MDTIYDLRDVLLFIKISQFKYEALKFVSVEIQWGRRILPRVVQRRRERNRRNG